MAAKPGPSRYERHKNHNLERAYQDLYGKDGTREKPEHPQTPLRWYFLQRLLEDYTNEEEFEVKMKIGNTQSQFLAMLDIKKQHIEPENVHNVIKAVVRFESSIGFSLYGWKALFKPTSVDNFFLKQILRLHISKELRSDTRELLKKSSIFQATKTFANIYAPIECPYLACETLKQEVAESERRAAFVPLSSREPLSAEKQLERTQKQQSLPDQSAKKF